jgi:hypothetical protein
MGRVNEVLAPKRKDISTEFYRGFQGMTEEPVILDDLIEAREALITNIVGEMPNEHRNFLVSFEHGEPNWALLALNGIADLPAVRWRQQNLDKLNQAARSALVARLEKALHR